MRTSGSTFALRLAKQLSPVLAAGALILTASAAHAAPPNLQRKGGQWGITFGGSACIPGKADCQRDEVLDGGITIDGKSQPSFGMAAEIGYRFNKFVFLGAAYDFGLFNTDYEVGIGEGFKRGYQNSVFAVVRPSLPLWRFDFGLGLGPGFSRQTYRYENRDKDYTQGFAWLFSPSIDFFVARTVFIGAKADIILNAHNRTCQRRGDTTTCIDGDNTLGRVHQTIFGLHVGGVFP